MNKKLLSLIFLACVSSTAIVLAGSESSGFPKGKHMKHHRGAMLDHIPNLTEEQRAALEALRAKRKSIEKVRGSTRGEGVSSLDANASDYQQQVEALAEAAAQRARERVLKKAQMHEQLQSILSEEQMQALQDAREHRGYHKRGKRSGSGG